MGSENILQCKEAVYKVDRFTKNAYLITLELYSPIPQRTQTYNVTGSNAGGNLRLSRIRFIIELNNMAVYSGVADEYSAQWLWYWVTIPKVQGSNPGLTTNL